MSFDAAFAMLQIPLALLTAALYGRQYQRHGVVPLNRYRWREWLRSMVWLSIAAISCGMVAWRLSTVSELVASDYRVAGGMAVQTIYQLVMLFAYLGLRDQSDFKK